MKKFTTSITLLFCCILAISQKPDYPITKNKVYNVSVNDDKRGFLTGITDTSLQYSVSRKSFGYSGAAENIHYSNIRSFKLKRQGSGTQSAVAGSIVGAVLGSLIGAATYKKPDPNSWVVIDFGIGFNILTGGILGVLGGGGLGALLGNFGRSYKPNAEKEKFREIYSSFSIQ